MILNILNTTMYYILNMVFPEEEKLIECPLYWGLGTD